MITDNVDDKYFQKYVVAKIHIEKLEAKIKADFGPYEIEIGKLKSYIEELEHNKIEFSKLKHLENKTKTLIYKISSLEGKLRAIISDPITGLYKRKYDRLKKMYIKLRDKEKPVKPIIIIDSKDKVDNYKLIIKSLNDSHKKMKDDYAELLEKTRDDNFLPKMTLEERIIFRESKYKIRNDELEVKYHELVNRLKQLNQW